MISLPPSPIFVPDKFNLCWVSVDTGNVHSRGEMIRLIGRYEQTIAGKKTLSEPPKRRSESTKLFELGRSM